MRYRVFNIKWDIDDGEASTPSEMVVNVPAEANTPADIEQYLTDEISNISGWCHDGYDFEPVNYGVRGDMRTGQFVPQVNGHDVSPTSFDETRALEIARSQASPS